MERDDVLRKEDALYIAIRDVRWNVRWDGGWDVRWDECRSLLQREDVARMVLYTHHDGDNVLYFACKRSAPIDVVRAIHSFDDSLVFTQNSYGCTPLYAAIAWQTEDVVDFLLEDAPETATIADTDGQTPLHLAVVNRRPASLLRKLLTIDPTAARATDKCFDTPLTTFARVNHPPFRDRNVKESFSLLLSSYVYGTVDRTVVDGLRPANEALRCRALPSRFLSALVSFTTRTECPRPDARGDFLLHAACSVRISDDKQND